MVDRITKEKRSGIMAKIHQPTKLEGMVHEWLEAEGIEHEMYPKVDCKPDIRVGELYIFVDGCFWHCCPIHYRRPKSRQDFWVPHVEGAEAKRKERRSKLPYKWIRIWEHEVKDGSFKEAISNHIGGKKP